MEVDSKIVEEALQSICILNKEMGGVLEAISWIKSIIFWGFGILTTLISATFVTVLRNLSWTKRNGILKVMK